MPEPLLLAVAVELDALLVAALELTLEETLLDVFDAVELALLEAPVVATVLLVALDVAAEVDEPDALVAWVTLTPPAPPVPSRFFPVAQPSSNTREAHPHVALRMTARLSEGSTRPSKRAPS